MFLDKAQNSQQLSDLISVGSFNIREYLKISIFVICVYGRQSARYKLSWYGY